MHSSRAGFRKMARPDSNEMVDNQLQAMHRANGDLENHPSEEDPSSSSAINLSASKDGTRLSSSPVADWETADSSAKRATPDWSSYTPGPESEGKMFLPALSKLSDGDSRSPRQSKDRLHAQELRDSGLTSVKPRKLSLPTPRLS